MNKIVVFSLERKFEKFEKPIFSAAVKELEILRKDNCYLEIYLAGNKRMRFLNKKFRNKDKPADVLSFNEPNNFPHPELAGRGGIKKTKAIGEIYLNLTNNQRLITNNSYKLLVHGLLHLFGYNHKKKSDRIRMEKMEQKILCLLPP